jgi:hypothetical protein
VNTVERISGKVSRSRENLKFAFVRNLDHLLNCSFFLETKFCFDELRLYVCRIGCMMGQVAPKQNSALMSSACTSAGLVA